MLCAKHHERLEIGPGLTPLGVGAGEMPGDHQMFLDLCNEQWHGGGERTGRPHGDEITKWMALSERDECALIVGIKDSSR